MGNRQLVKIGLGSGLALAAVLLFTLPHGLQESDRRTPRDEPRALRLPAESIHGTAWSHPTASMSGRRTERPGTGRIMESDDGSLLVQEVPLNEVLEYRMIIR